MENLLQIKVRNSECNMPRNRRILLTYEHWGMVPCKLQETEDECIFIFRTEGLTAGREACTLDIMDKYRLLANCAKLEGLATEYRFALSPENIMYDRNLCPLILLRDKKDETEENVFCKQYKALAAALLYSRYSFDQYYHGGDSLYKKKKIIKSLQDYSVTEQLETYFLQEWEAEKQYITNRKTLVKRTDIWKARIAIPILAVTCLASIYSWASLKTTQLPYQEKLLTAYSSYLSSEYIQVEDVLYDIAIDRLPLETQYILARSYIYTEGLTPAQRDNLLAGISMKTDAVIYEYWIQLGRGEYEQAVDTAKRLGDDELLLYAYIKQSAYTKADTTLSGEEKASLISALESDISKMSESIANEKEHLEETTRAVIDIDDEDRTGGETDENIDHLQ